MTDRSSFDGLPGPQGAPSEDGSPAVAPIDLTTLAEWTSPAGPAYRAQSQHWAGPELEGPVTQPAPSAPSESSAPSALRRIVVMAVVMVVLLAGAVTAVLVTGKTSADAAVASAVTSSLNDRTAVLTLGGSVNLAGTNVPINGTGHTDFTRNTMDMQLKLDSGSLGQSVTEKAVYLDGVMYLNLGDLIGQVLPGKSWLSLDLSQLSPDQSATSPLGVGGSAVSNDPMALLKVLGQHGNDATDLGPSTINGDPVEGYAVTVNQAAISAQLAHADLPAWMRQAVAAVKNPHSSYKVYVNQAGLLDRLITDLSLTVSGQKLTEEISMDFSQYGTPVTIAAPPADQVGTFDDFLQMAKALSSETAT